LGAPPHVEGVDGTLFAVWAPTRARQRLGDFNRWVAPIHAGASGRRLGAVLPGIGADAISSSAQRRQRRGGAENRPYAQMYEMRPYRLRRHRTSAHRWTRRLDGGAARYDWQHAPMSIYEVHLGLRRQPDGSFVGIAICAAAGRYVKAQGYTHID